MSKVISITLVSLLFSSCHTKIDFSNGIDGNGKVEKQTRTVENNFSKINVSKGLIVEVEQSSSYKVEVEADENLLKHITTRVDNGTLYISSDENIDEAKAKTIYVQLPNISGIETNSGASLTSKNTLKGTSIEVTSSSGSSSTLDLEFDKISITSSSGSSLILKGKALELKTSSASGSTLLANSLIANDVTSDAASGSSTNVHPMVNLVAKASSGASVVYDSNPKSVSKTESSGGSVDKE